MCTKCVYVPHLIQQLKYPSELVITNEVIIQTAAYIVHIVSINSFTCSLCSHYCIVSIVHGGWSSWIREPCSKTCGGGLQNVTRECINPRPSCGGNSCSGSGFQQEKCNDICCPGEVTNMRYHVLSRRALACIAKVETIMKFSHKFHQHVL